MADHESSVVSSISPNNGNVGTNEDHDYKWDRIWEFVSAALGAILGGLHGYYSSESEAESIHVVVQIVTESLIFAGLGYLVKRADLLNMRFIRFQDKYNIDRSRIIETEMSTSTELARLSRRAERSIDIKDGIYGTIASAFAHDNDIVRRCVLSSISETLRPLRIDRDLLEADDDRLSRNLYENFWDELLEEQRKRGEANPLEVYVVHSSTIKVFEDKGPQNEVLIQQGRFRNEGGRIRRILIRDPKNDNKSQYERVMTQMELAGIMVKMLEVPKNHKFRDDFLLVEVGQQSYVLQWRWNPSSGSGVVSGTRIHMSREGCSSFYGSWRRILHELERRSPTEDLTDWRI